MITVAIPTLDRKPYALRALKPLARQTADDCASSCPCAEKGQR